MTIVSLVIPTQNRPEQLKQCLNSFLNIFPHQYRDDLELIIVDQGVGQKKSELNRLNQLSGYQIKYYRCRGNLSQARNFAMGIVKTPLVAFVDDDCLFTESYLQTLLRLNYQSLLLQKVAVVFGPVFPYQPQKHPQETCVSVFHKKSTAPVHKIAANWRTYGCGNNMLVVKSVFKKIGGFKLWLGKGSVGESGEDTEFSLRCIREGYQLGYQPKLLLYHNHWLPENGYLQFCRYYCGGVAAYAYYYFRGVSECWPFIYQYWQWGIIMIKSNLKQTLRMPKKCLISLFSSLICLGLLCKGLVLGLWYAKIRIDENRQ